MNLFEQAFQAAANGPVAEGDLISIRRNARPGVLHVVLRRHGRPAAEPRMKLAGQWSQADIRNALVSAGLESGDERVASLHTLLNPTTEVAA